MAFADNTQNFVTDSQANTNAPRIHRYSEDATLVSLKAANYFNGAVNGAAGGGYGLRDGDVILVAANDGISFLEMAVSAGGDATVNAANDFA